GQQPLLVGLVRMVLPPAELFYTLGIDVKTDNPIMMRQLYCQRQADITLSDNRNLFIICLCANLHIMRICLLLTVSVLRRLFFVNDLPETGTRKPVIAAIKIQLYTFFFAVFASREIFVFIFLADYTYI